MKKLNEKISKINDGWSVCERNVHPFFKKNLFKHDCFYQVQIGLEAFMIYDRNKDCFLIKNNDIPLLEKKLEELTSVK